MKLIVNESVYFKWLDLLVLQLIGKGNSFSKKIDFDCIVALKRSGWIGGVYLSNKLNKPLFTVSEIGSIPKHFKTILLFDDKTSTGKSMAKAKNKIKAKVITCCLFKQGDYCADIVTISTGRRVSLFYEIS